MIEQNKISYQSSQSPEFTRKNSQNSSQKAPSSGISSQETRQKIARHLYSKILNKERPPIRAMLDLITAFQQKNGKKQKSKEKLQKLQNHSKKQLKNDRLAKKEISKLFYLAKLKEHQNVQSQNKKKQKETYMAQQLQSKMDIMQTLQEINYLNANSFFPKPIQKSTIQNSLRSSHSKIDFSDKFFNQQSRTVSLATSINYQNPQQYIIQNSKTIDVNNGSNSQSKASMKRLLQKQNKFEGYLNAVNHLNHLRKHKHVGKKYLYKTIDANKEQCQTQKLRKSNQKLSKYFYQKKINASNMQSQSRKSLQNLSHTQINSYVGKILQNKIEKYTLKKQQELLLKSIQRQKFSVGKSRTALQNGKAEYHSKGKIFYNNFNSINKKNKKQQKFQSQIKKSHKNIKQNPLLFPQIKSYVKFKDLKGKTIQ